MKERIKSFSFWAEVLGAIFLVLGAFGVEIGDSTASTVINAVCTVLVMFGIVDAPKKSAQSGDDSSADGHAALGSLVAPDSDKKESKD